MATTKPSSQRTVPDQVIGSGSNDQINKHNAPAEEFKILNTLIEVDEVLGNVRKLLDILRHCNNKMAERTKFFQELDSQEN